MSMDKILKADEQPFVSKIIVFRDFLNKASTLLQDFSIDPDVIRQKGLKIHWVTPKLYDIIEQTIDVSDMREDIFNYEMDEGLDRNQTTSQKCMHDENSQRRNSQFKSIALRSLRYDHADVNAIARKAPILEDLGSEMEDPSDGPEVLRPPPLRIADKDLIVTISICLGYTRELEYHEIRLGRLLKVTDRIELTGEHTVEDLRNAFSCQADYTFTEDFSEKTPTLEDMTKNKFPSNMFFFHDTFYVDENLPEDPSEIVKKWAAKHKCFGPMRTLPITTKLADITARLGQPYVYIHQGICEHLIVFNDLSIRDDTHEDVQFPRRIIERNFRRIACDCCKEESAQWMVLHHEDLMVNMPGHVCNSCYQEFCFDVNGEKVTEFKAVPYCDRKEIGEGGKFLANLRFPPQ